MSKVINTLKPPELTQFQEDLAKTYFSTPSPQPESRPKSPQGVKPSGLLGSFWTVIVVLFLGFAAVLFALDKIEINIRVIPAISSSQNQANTVFFDQNGEPNRNIIKEIVFYENASAESRWGKKFITLSSDTGSKKAVLGIEFVSPLNMKENYFWFLAKGQKGQEEMRITLKDAENNFCYSKTNVMQGLWQQFAIDAEQAKNFVDPEKIVSMNVELNPGEKNILPRSKIYLKELSLKNKQGG